MDVTAGQVVTVNRKGRAETYKVARGTHTYTCDGAAVTEFEGYRLVKTTGLFSSQRVALKQSAITGVLPQ